MYFRMLKRDIKDKPGLNIVTFIFMVAAVTFMVIGSTLIYAMFVGEKKTYAKCNSSDVFVRLDQSISDKEGLVERFMKDVDESPVMMRLLSQALPVLNLSEKTLRIMCIILQA